ncbi:FAD dependent oxidoreductase [Wolfiporia cocos MD-104 SS10]|uniref:FAD dependent oxidoreductase n=1 Tax=Wolfiporia cocos (strain MD-104) TaxID=742152 RepID=A0A2H3JDN6_WOLCO|nr:FAD dependent oxidoreductase [Wolfiporia cocos MD-104 SS10]
MSSDTLTRHIIIVGGGIVGCTTAYYLCSHPAFASSATKVTLIEASARGVAQGASGKAGGLVAKWAYPKELVNVSFPEHVRLAQEHNGAHRWGWRFVGCGSWEGRGGSVGQDAGTGVGAGGQRRSLEKTNGLDDGWNKKKRAESGLPDDLTWVNAEQTDAYSPMAPAGATAQVHPYLFTTSMLALAQERGLQFVRGKVTEIDVDGEKKQVRGVRYSDSGESHNLAATHVILAAGAWTPKILPSVPISGTRAHSITIRPQPGITISPYVLFTEIAFNSSAAKGRAPQQVSPEIYARPDNEVYCCGPGDNSPVPETVDDVLVDDAACESIRTHIASISTELREGTVDKRQACFLPVVSAGGGPIVGEVSTVAKGLIIATGHTCWGICNAPGTAKAISELIMEGKIKCANLKTLHPGLYI